jgi:hypothetical protein
MTVAAQTGERETMVIDLGEHRLKRQLRSVSAASTLPAACKPAPLDAVVVLMWRKVSPSAHVMVDPRNGTRAVIRDTRSDAGRYLWSVVAAGELLDAMSQGRTDDLAQAKSIAEATLHAHYENPFEDPTGMLATWHKPETKLSTLGDL